MITNIFLPRNIADYYLIPEKIVAIDIQKTNIYASLILFKAKKRILIDVIEQNIEPDINISYNERVINALRLLKLRLPKHDYLILTISSSHVIFKDITLPLLSEKKIKMVVPFEVESLLPFSLDQAYIDSIIIKEDKIEKVDYVLVSCVKQDYLDNFISLFEKAEVKLDKISVDILDLYELYKRLYNNRFNSVIIDINLNTITLAIIIEGYLKYIRIIPKGLIISLKKISSELNIDINNIINQLINFGLADNDDQYTKVINNAISELFQELKFNIDSYQEKLKSDKIINKILLTGLACQINGISSISESIINISTEIFQVSNLLKDNIISTKIKNIDNNFLKSIAGSLNLISNFNLDKKAQDEREDKTILTQIISTVALFLLIISTFSIYSYLRVRKLKKTVEAARQEAFSEINKMFKIRQPEDNKLSSLNKSANLELSKRETAWQKLSVKNRYSFLFYLSQLSKCIKPKDIFLEINMLDIKNNQILIYGSVPGFAELDKLQNQINKCLLKPEKAIALKEYNFTKDPIIISTSNLKD